MPRPQAAWRGIDDGSRPEKDRRQARRFNRAPRAPTEQVAAAECDGGSTGKAQGASQKGCTESGTQPDADEPGPSNRTAARTNAALAVQLEVMARDLEQISELRTEMSDLRTLVEALTSTVEGLVANQRAHDSDLEPETTPEKRGPSAEAAEGSDATDDEPTPETEESASSAP